MEKISIIVTSYNHEKFMNQTLLSILNQSYSNWELLVGDDNSSDRTFEIIQSFAETDTRIHAWRHPENLGIVGNINFLLSKVSPESSYVAFLEGDDLFLRENLEKKLAIFAQNPHLALVYNNLDLIDENGNIFQKNFLKKSPRILKNELLGKHDFFDLETYYYSYSSLMIKKEVLLQEKILNISPNKLFSVSDWDLFFRISTKYACFGIDESLTLYRKHHHNFSHQKSKKTSNPILSDMFLLGEYYQKTGIFSREEYQKFLGTLLYAKSFEFLFQNQKKQAWKYFLKSLFFTKKIRILGSIKFVGVFLFGKILIREYE